jgi:hypothetical protein
VDKIIELKLTGSESGQTCLIQIDVDFDSDPDLCTFQVVRVFGNYLPERFEVVDALYFHFNKPERLD